MKRFQDLNLCDDFLFKEVMKDERLVIGFLEMVLNLKDKITGINFIETEKTIQNRFLDKSIRLDVYVKDEEDNVYNIEIQNGKFANLPKRCRKYQADIDGSALKPGEDYANLKKQYIIFVCTGDPFGKGMYMYTFVNRCNEDFDLELGDGSTKIFLNTKGKNGSASAQLKAFLNFLEKSTEQNAELSKDIYVQQLSQKIEAIKRDEALGGVFMTIEEKMNETLEQGIEQGIEKGIEQIAKKMKDEGYPLDQIAKITELPLEKIEKL